MIKFNRRRVSTVVSSTTWKDYKIEFEEICMYVSRLDSRDEFEYLEAVSSSIVSIFRLVHGLDLHETSVTEWIYLDVASSGTRSWCPLHCIISRGPGRQEEERFFVAFCAPSPLPYPRDIHCRHLPRPIYPIRVKL